jgi:hypothetical protein
MAGENSYFLCSHGAAAQMVVRAEHERDNLLEELQSLFTGDIDIRVYAVSNVTGASIAGDLLVNGEVCRSYIPIDLCFQDIHTLMLQRMLEAQGQK